MSFNSAIFLLVFLPVTLLGYYFLGRSKWPRSIVFWLIIASLVFYAWANPVYLALIAGSAVFNYFMGKRMAGTTSTGRRKLVMGLGITANILLLGYFKYANFFMETLNSVFGSSFTISAIMLPLAISFFTLQQIAYLVDTYRGERYKYSFWDYCLFVTFFPKLISGPIVRMKEMMPQITGKFQSSFNWQTVAVSLTVIVIGLFQKILADHIQGYVNLVFNAANTREPISFLNAWAGAIGYSLQLYFDFTGYSDIAIGLGLLFGLKLPLNFWSPYKATSIIDFWRRWHITLSRFIRDYIYIPLGGNRHGLIRQMIYLLVAMSIAGLWHGAGWTFIIWGALHGLYLVVNHIWRRLKKMIGSQTEKTTWWGNTISILLTFLVVAIAWVFFRADSIDAAWAILKTMTGIQGLSLFGVSKIFMALAGMGLFICWVLPNTQEFLTGFQPALDDFTEKPGKRYLSGLRWQPSFWYTAIIAGMFVLVILEFNRVHQFIYFRF
jgi:alginate O-acetyltransferase complex protein AlgI